MLVWLEEQWAGWHSWCRTVAGLGIAAAAGIGEGYDVQQIGSGSDWCIGIAENVAVIAGVARTALEHAWVEHIAGTCGHPLQ